MATIQATKITTSKCETCGMPFTYRDNGIYIPTTCATPECIRPAIHKELIRLTDGRLIYGNRRSN